MYAMKYMNKAQIIKKRAVENVLREVEILKKLQYPFLVNLWFTFHDIEDIFMVLDLMLGEKGGEGRGGLTSLCCCTLRRRPELSLGEGRALPCGAGQAVHCRACADPGVPQGQAHHPQVGSAALLCVCVCVFTALCCWSCSGT